MKKRQKILNIIYNLEEIFASLIMFSIVFLTIVNIILRYIFSSPIQWYEETVLFLFVWLIMIGLCLAYRDNSLMSIDIIDMLIPKKYHIYLNIFVDFMVVLALLSLIVIGWNFSLSAFVKLTDILRIPYFYIDIAIVVGASLCIKDFIIKYVQLIYHKE